MSLSEMRASLREIRKSTIVPVSRMKKADVALELERARKRAEKKAEKEPVVEVEKVVKAKVEKPVKEEPKKKTTSAKPKSSKK